MKYIFTLLTILIFNFSFSDNKIQSNQPTENQIKVLENRINKIEKNNFTTDLVQEYKDLNSLYSDGFTVLLALFGLVFPALLYFVQIKPAQDALKEAKLLQIKLETDFEKSFEEHFNKSKIKAVDQAIESFENSNEQQLPTSLVVLDTYKSEKFNDFQILKLLNLSRQEDNNYKPFFANIIAFQKSVYIESYFVDLIKADPKDEICINGAIYFAINNKSEYYDLIASIVINGYSLLGMISTLSHSSKSFAIQFLHNEFLANNLLNHEIISICEFIKKETHPKIVNESIDDSPLWKKYLELINE